MVGGTSGGGTVVRLFDDGSMKMLGRVMSRSSVPSWFVTTRPVLPLKNCPPIT